MGDNDGWQLIEAASFESPASPASSRVRRGLRRLGRLLGRGDEADSGFEGGAPTHDNFDRRPAVAALTRWAEDWPDTGPGVRFLLDPPFSGTAHIARDWAGERRWPRLAPPDEQELATADVAGWWRRQGVHGPWLMDSLARCLLRTPAGLRFLRALLVRLLEGEFGPGLVVSNSWTHRFIIQAFELVLPHPHCFAPVTPALLGTLGIRGSTRQLTALAADARGNAGVALALWAAEHGDNGGRPELPAEADDTTAFVLYALLLHDGLASGPLQQVLPMLGGARLAACLQRLEYCGQVELRGACWRVRPAAYPAVREFLAGRDHCLDDF
ncbi:hypothetical protein GU3_11365 [Oceanimonas sp. GK1]|uniref:hypothetical protein n=1 Tax=Oceanimonas sp. (strain GK1 / IBRC-M 10197) TaxID=511062 RepID=UPI000249551D|nr:hypothetical protein [Oceanimonas sp. GK1]AEY02028.1 hypothetical protein GU3_11365 [Oceanimonas sp. GK1]